MHTTVREDISSSSDVVDDVGASHVQGVSKQFEVPDVLKNLRDADATITEYGLNSSLAIGSVGAACVGSGWFSALVTGFALGLTTAWYLSHSKSRKRKEMQEGLLVSTSAVHSSRSTQRLLNDSIFSFFGRSAGSSDNEICIDSTTIAKMAKKEDFLTGIFSQLWTFINPALSTAIQEAIEPILKENLSSILSSIQLVKVNLGNVPIHIDNVVVHEIRRHDPTDEKSPKYVQFDMDVIWDGNIEIGLKADLIGKFGIKSIKLFGRMSFHLKPLTKELPCFAGISYSFLNSPYLTLNFTGIASIAEFSLLERQVHKLIADTLNGIIVLPHRMYFRLDSRYTLDTLYQPPHGIARITVLDGHGFVIKKGLLFRDDIPDVYCKVSLGGGTIHNRMVETPVVPNCLKPVWNYSMDFICFAYDQLLTIDPWDQDLHPLDSDDDLDKCHVTIRDLLLAKDKTLEMELGDTSAFVRVKLELISLKTKLRLPNRVGQEKSKEPLYGGLVAILVTKAFDVPLQEEEAMTYVEVTASTGEQFKTGVCKRALNPEYDSIFHIPLDLDTIGTLQEKQEQEYPYISFSLMKESKNPKEENAECLGVTSIPFKSLVKNPIIKEKRSIGTNGASLELCVLLSGTVKEDGAAPEPDEHHGKSLRQTESSVQKAIAKARQTLANQNSITKKITKRGTSNVKDASESNDVALPTHKVKIMAVKGRGFKVVKRRLRKDDIPDVYLKICVIREGMIKKDCTIWTTSVEHDTCTPEWHESKMFDSGDNSDIICIDAWEYNRKTKDRHYGEAQISINRILLRGGQIDVELLDKSDDCTGLFITIGCELQTKH